MKKLSYLFLLLVVLWASGCQNKDTEAYLANLAEENATLLEMIQKKNQELDQLTAQLQQVQDSGVVTHTGAASQTAAIAKTTATGSAQTNKLPLQPAKVVIAAGYPTSPAQQVKSVKAVAANQSGKQVSKYAQPHNVEEYLNQISDPAIELATRKAWKKTILQAFANHHVEIFAEKKGFVNRYTATTLLDLLVYFPHQVKVSKIVKGPQDKIIQLRIQLNRQA